MSNVHEVSICAIVRNEGPYLLEWIAYHKAIFVDHFYVYDNESTDGTGDILKKLERAGLLTHIAWPDSHPTVIASGVGPQVPAYNDFLRFRHQTKWVAFIDVDEFLVPHSHEDIRSWIAPFSDVGGIGVNWRMFGSSGHETYSNGLVVDRFVKRAVDSFEANRHVKTIARADCIERVNTHICYLRGSSSLVDVERSRIDISKNGVHDRVCDGSIQLNHYFTRSREEWMRKIARGRVSRPPKDPSKFRGEDQFNLYDRNEIDDRRILRFRSLIAANLDLLNDLVMLDRPDLSSQAGPVEVFG